MTKVTELTTRRRAECPSVPGRIRMSAHLQQDVLHTDKMAGDLSLDFVPRNNRQSWGCIPDDTVEYWTTQAFTAASGTDYVLRLIVGSETKDYIFAAAPAVVAWEQRCSDFVKIFQARPGPSFMPVKVDCYPISRRYARSSGQSRF